MAVTGRPRSAALDGLRGIAVASVVFFHASVGWPADGLLGVDIFFALSGFLITTLLIGEINRHGSLNLRRFFGRRALRLMPALLPVALIAPVIAGLTLNRHLAKITAIGAVTTFTYVTNWYDMTGHAPGLFGHTWSLAVEGQFYFIWPLILAWAARRSLRLIAPTATLISLAAIVERSVLATRSSFLRVYQGTDTRADALLIGCALAAFLATATAVEKERSRRTIAALCWPACACMLLLLFQPLEHRVCARTRAEPPVDDSCRDAGGRPAPPRALKRLGPRAGVASAGLAGAGELRPLPLALPCSSFPWSSAATRVRSRSG